MRNRIQFRAQTKLQDLVSRLPVDTPIRRRARRPVSMMPMSDEADLEDYLATIREGAHAFDRRATAARQSSITASVPVAKEIVFTAPKFGLTFQREQDAFGYKPIVVVQVWNRCDAVLAETNPGGFHFEGFGGIFDSPSRSRPLQRALSALATS